MFQGLENQVEGHGYIAYIIPVTLNFFLCQGYFTSLPLKLPRPGFPNINSFYTF